MDYIRIKTTSRDSETQSLRDATSSSVSSSVSESVSTANDIKELLKDWIKLYPDSFAPDVEFKIYQIEDGDIIIQLHEDMSSLAVSLLVLYLESMRQRDNETTSIDSESQSLRDAKLVSKSESVSELISQSSIANSQQPIAYITIDDTEVLLKQNIGKRAMLFCESTSQQPTAVRFLLENNYVLDYDFERKPQPVKDSRLQFEEMEFVLPDDYEVVKVGDVIKKKIDELLETEELTPKKMLWYLVCGAVGLAIGLLIVYFTGMRLC